MIILLIIFLTHNNLDVLGDTMFTDIYRTIFGLFLYAARSILLIFNCIIYKEFNQRFLYFK